MLFNATLIGNVAKNATVDALSVANLRGNRTPKRTMRLGTADIIFKTSMNRQVTSTVSDAKHFEKDNYAENEDHILSSK